MGLDGARAFTTQPIPPWPRRLTSSTPTLTRPAGGKADAYYYLAQACQADGKTELARKYAAEGLGKYPHNPRMKGFVAKL